MGILSAMSRGLVRRLGVVLLLAGLGLLGWVGWHYFGTDITSNHKMDELERNLRDQWKPAAKPPTTTGPGTPNALLRIPKFGADWEKPIVEGVGKEELAQGIGHYPETQLPGQPGNFAVAGHRITHGSPFRKLLELTKGDKVVVETADAVYTYEMDTSPHALTLKPSDNWVLQPVPGKPSQQPTRSIITLTTCQDLFHSPDRSVGFGHLTKVDKKP
jgi:sortase A